MEKWDDKYPVIGCACARHRGNAIKSLNSVIRKAINNRKIFPSDQPAVRIVFLAISRASKKWTRPPRNWKPAMNRCLRGDQGSSQSKKAVTQNTLQAHLYLYMVTFGQVVVT